MISDRIRKWLRKFLYIDESNIDMFIGPTGPMGPKGDRGEPGKSFIDYCREWLIKEKKESERIVRSSSDEATFNAFIQHMYCDIIHMIESDVIKRRSDWEYRDSIDVRRNTDVIENINKFRGLLKQILPLIFRKTLDDTDRCIESLKIIYEDASYYALPKIKEALLRLEYEETRYCNIHDFKKDAVSINPETYDGFINFTAHLKRLGNYFESNRSSMVKNTCRYSIVDDHNVSNKNIVSVYEDQTHRFIEVEEDVIMTICINIVMLISSIGITLMIPDELYHKDFKLLTKSLMRQLLSLLYFIYFGGTEADEEGLKFLAQIIDEVYMTNKESNIYYLCNLFE